MDGPEETKGRTRRISPGRRTLFTKLDELIVTQGGPDTTSAKQSSQQSEGLDSLDTEAISILR